MRIMQESTVFLCCKHLALKSESADRCVSHRGLRRARRQTSSTGYTTEQSWDPESPEGNLQTKHTHIHSDAHKYPQIHSDTLRYIHIHTNIHTYTHKYTHRYTQIYTYTLRYTQVHTNVHKYAQIYKHTFTHKYTHSYIKRHIHVGVSLDRK